MSLVEEYIHHLTTRRTYIYIRTEELMLASISHGSVTWQGFDKFVHGPHVGVDGGLRFCILRDDPDHDSERTDYCKVWFRSEMVQSQVSGVFQQGCTSEVALFGNVHKRRIDQT